MSECEDINGLAYYSGPAEMSDTVGQFTCVCEEEKHPADLYSQRP